MAITGLHCYYVLPVLSCCDVMCMSTCGSVWAYLYGHAHLQLDALLHVPHPFKWKATMILRSVLARGADLYLVKGSAIIWNFSYLALKTPVVKR